MSRWATSRRPAAACTFAVTAHPARVRRPLLPPLPAAVVMADIRQQVAAGARHITFGDPDFLNGPTHALKLARALHAEFQEVTFDFTAKIEHLLRHRAHLRDLVELGCVFIVSAAESLSDTVLAYLDKGHTRADIVAALQATSEAGVELRPTWVAFTPWTRLEDYRDLLDFIEAVGLIDRVDPVQYSLGSSFRRGPCSCRARPCALIWARSSRKPSPTGGPIRPADGRAPGSRGCAVAAAAECGDDAAATFDRVRALADEVAGEPLHPSVAARLDPGRPRPPRITEPWFC